MPIPDYQSTMTPLLKFASDQKEHSYTEAVNYISDLFSLTEEEKRQKLPSGYNVMIDNRVRWAGTYLKKAGLLEGTGRGRFKITKEGFRVTQKVTEKINIKFLRKYPSFRDFINYGKTKITDKKEVEEITPEELMEKGNIELQENVAQELLEKLRTVSPDFFEQVVCDLLRKMHYGEVEVTGGPGDNGIDGIVYQDKLRIDRIYLQAKRYSATNIITPNMLKQFIGTLESIGADKGVFITTSEFHKDVSNVLKGSHKKIVLVDGKKLVDLMLAHNLGVSIDKTYEIKSIDENYFKE